MSRINLPCRAWTGKNNNNANGRDGAREHEWDVVDPTISTRRDGFRIRGRRSRIHHTSFYCYVYAVAAYRTRRPIMKIDVRNTRRSRVWNNYRRLRYHLLVNARC